MQLNKLIVFTAGLFLMAFSSCKYSKDYEVINANNKFSISVPSWMKEQEDLKPGADFQYANRFRNIYAIGEKLDAVTSGQGRSQVMANNLNVLRKSLKNALVTDSIDIKANEEIKGTRVEMYGKMSGENIYFTEVLFEGKKGLYHISVWTRSEDRKLHFKQDINNIVASFKEL